jgi:hypothetical protein
MRGVAVVAVLATLAVTVPAAARGPASAARSGLYGRATKGPLTPVCSVSVPCYGPAARALIGFVMRGRPTRWTRADGDGDYRIALAPGRYTVKSKIGFGAVEPATLRVKAGRFTRADLSLDTGIR